ncbi:MAG: alpha/beta fold hydrolase [Bacteroidota bacterium]
MKNWKVISLGIFIAYLLFAQSCLRMRTSDSEAIKIFKTAGVAIILNNFIDSTNALHFAKTGNDSLPTLLFVHGSPGSWNAYEKYLLDIDLCKKYRLISIDRMGFGYSHFNQAQNLQSHSDIINKLLKSIDNNKPVYVIGHSYGGPVVANMAADNARINGIVIIAGALSATLEEPEKWRKIFINNPLECLVPGALNPSNKELYWLKDDLKVLDKKLNQINCKVVVIHGTKDQLVPYENTLFMKNNLTAADTIKIVSITDENHFIPWNNFELVKKELMFLE